MTAHLELLAVRGGSAPPDAVGGSDSCFAAGTLEADPRSAGVARRFVRSNLRNWGLDALLDRATFTVSELVTNALRHGRAGTWSSPAIHPLVLGLLGQGDDLVCAVFDPGSRLPVLRQAQGLVESGRGLSVVAELSDAWGWSAPGPYGKVVWARFGESADPADEEDPLARLLLLVEVLTGAASPRLQRAAVA